MNETLTIEQADQLGQLVRAVRAHGKLRYYPCDAETSTTFVLRSFVTSPDDNSFLRLDADIRDGAVWLTGIWEVFMPVRDILAALANAGNGEFPLALFEGK